MATDHRLPPSLPLCTAMKSAEAAKSRSTYTRHPKPPYSYIALIAMAIRDSADGRLTLAGINEYLVSKFPFFRGEYQGWKNSIRHNLSLNECFVKILRDPTRPWGKDNFWSLNPDSEYTFAGGVFRRRRKRLAPPPPPKRSPVAFSIDALLGPSPPKAAPFPHIHPLHYALYLKLLHAQTPKL